MIRMTRRRWAKALWAVYPPVVTCVVVVTGNHWIFDAATGALVAAVSARGRADRVRARTARGVGVGAASGSPPRRAPDRLPAPWPRLP